MKKIEKWLVCINDMLPEPTTYLLHTREPRFLVEVKDLDLNTPPNIDVMAENLVYINAESLPELYELEIVQEYGDYSTPETLRRQLKMAVKWYREYLKWEDGNNGAMIPDYNPQVPGLKVLYSNTADKWMTIYEGVVKIHYTEPEMDQYLRTITNHEDLNGGFVTYI